MKTKIETIEIDLPAYWASYLINGDDSGYSAEEFVELLAFRDSHPDLYCVSADADSAIYGDIMLDTGTFHGDLLTYTFHRRGK